MVDTKSETLTKDYIKNSVKIRMILFTTGLVLVGGLLGILLLSLNSQGQLKQSQSQLKTIINQNHVSTVQRLQDQATQTDANKQLLLQEDAYIKCLVTLFTNHAYVTTPELDTCQPLAPTQKQISASSGVTSTTTTPAHTSTTTTTTTTPATTSTTTTSGTPTSVAPVSPKPQSAMKEIGNVVKGLYHLVF